MIQRLLTTACMAALALQMTAAGSSKASRTPVRDKKDIISLVGEWLFHQGDERKYDDKIMLPGSMLTNSKGDMVTVDTKWTGSLYDSSFYFNPYMEPYRVPGKMKFPFFLTPSKHYTGAAWYKRTVFIPNGWNSQVELFLERPHIETTVLVNGKVAGRDSSLSVPHTFNITPLLNFGQDNDIEIRIYNGIENVCVGQDSHSVTDQTQGNWNGMVGKIELRKHPACRIRNVQVYPDLQKREVRIDLRADKSSEERKLTVSIDGQTHDLGTVKPGEDGIVSRTVSLGGKVKLWDEFTPNLYDLGIKLGDDEVKTQFGVRDIRTDGRKMMLNGHEIFIRGTVGNCCFPLTGFPPTDVDSWTRIFTVCKEYGLNMMRFHSYCPPEAAFIAADRIGFYLQPEGPSWPNHGVKLGTGMTIDRYLLEETQRMVEEYGNHPSFLFLAAGNEPAGNWVDWCGKFVEYWHSTGDNRRLYCGASVGGGWAWDPKSDYHVKGGARGLEWNRTAPQTMDDFEAQVTQYIQKGSTPITFDINEPYISHEQGQWCAFPDFKEIEQYTGAYKAGNFEIFRDMMRDAGMASQAEKFLLASGKLQMLAYKYEMERNMRTQGYTGFQLLGLNDYSGQGTALVGPLNVFWRDKGYCRPEDWNFFCSPVVPLARMPKFVFTDKDTLTADIMMYNATAGELGGMQLEASVIYNDNMKPGFASEVCGSKTTVGIGKHHVGAYRLAIKELVDSLLRWEGTTLPHKFTLQLNHTTGDGISCRNWYDFWVYPSETAQPKLPKNVYVCDTLDAKAIKTLQKGGRVLLTAAGRVTYGNDVKQNYLPVFWNTSWFKMRPPHTTGVYIDNTRPMFKNFPTDNWSNLNWWELVNKAQVMNLSEFPKEYQPDIQPIDTWHVCRKLGMVAEANVLRGKLLITTMDVSSNLGKRPVARQMRKALLEYVSSDDFEPQFSVDLQVIRDLYEKEAPKVNMFTNESPDELKPKLK